MYLTAAQLTQRRAIAILVIRLAAVLLALASVLPLLSWLTEGIRDGDLLDLGYYFGRILAGVGCIVAGVVAWALAPALAKWMTPVPPVGLCPACGYRIGNEFTQRCPECGLILAPDANAAAPTELSEIARVAMLRSVSVVIIRLVVLAALLWLTISFSASLVSMVIYGYGGPDFIIQIVAGFGVAIVVTIAAFLFAPLLAVAAVPAPGSILDFTPGQAIAPILVLAGLIAAVSSLWLLSDDDGSRTPILTLLAGLGVAIDAFPLASHAGWGKPPKTTKTPGDTPEPPQPPPA